MGSNPISRSMSAYPLPEDCQHWWRVYRVYKGRDTYDIGKVEWIDDIQTAFVMDGVRSDEFIEVYDEETTIACRYCDTTLDVDEIVWP